MKKLLLVVDFQKDFVDGALGFTGAENLEEPILDKIREYRNNDDIVAFTFDTHEPNYLETQEGRNLPVVHCVEGTQGWQLYGNVKNMIKEEDPCFFKPGFGSLELVDYLESNLGQIESVELVGLVSNICIITNAILVKTALPEVEVTVDSRCTDSFDPELNKAALTVMKGLQIKIIE
ncbi:MAG: cysteine hydrolase [Eubacteriales bacterium]|jgi:nicotinamidase/pyrazinamidase|nr:cysteine hydrolase [Eubacteriales bacterium]